MKKITPIILSLLLVALSVVAVPPKPAHALQKLVFPVLGAARYSNDFYVPRPGTIHNATDIMASKMQPIVAVTEGTIINVNYPQRSWGYSISIRDAAGYTYNYLHLNDDTPGTNDGNGGAMNAYAPDMVVGNQVIGGQLIGWNGDSGNSNGVPHLHFEIEMPDGTPVNPYSHLNEAWRIKSPIIPPSLPNELLPYGTNFTGGLNIEMGNFDADPESELITGAGKNGSPHVRLFDNNTNAPIGPGFYAYGAGFQGGVDVAAGDVDGDGIDEIITGTGPGASPHVRVLKADGTEVGGFYAYSPNFPGGVRVAAGDVDGDGKAEIITAPASLGGPHIRVLKPDGTEVSGFYAYASSFFGGVDVTSADVSGDTKAEIITAPGPGGGPHVRIFDGTGVTQNNDFNAYGSFTGGVKLSAGNVRTDTPKAEILVAPWATGGPHIKMFGGTGMALAEKMFMEPWWGGYHEIAAGKGVSYAGTDTNRRASIRNAFE